MTASPPTGGSSELVTRAIVGALMAGGALVSVWAGGLLFWVVTAALAIGVVAEWAALAGATRNGRRLMMFSLSVPLAIMGPLAAGPDFFALGLLAGAAVFVLIALRRPVLAFGIVYAGLPVLSLLLIRSQPGGLVLAFWTFSLVWLCDIGAYFAGRAFGGQRLAPLISPNKTWSGALGGVVAAALFGAAMHVYFGLPWRLTLATPVLAMLAEAGDLYESWLKRQAGVKDSGSMLPGHGGLMDRLDGLIPVAPVAAFLIMLPQLRGLIE